jgi:hypothetical protein
MTGWRTRLALVRMRRELRRHGVPAGRRREIAAEVGANVHAAAADFGEREALRRLVDLDALAAGYADDRAEPGADVVAGLKAAIVATALLAALALIRVPTFNAVDVFDRHTGAMTWTWQVWHLWRFGGDVRTDTLFEADVYWTAFVLVGALAFGIRSHAGWLTGLAVRSRSASRPGGASDG